MYSPLSVRYAQVTGEELAWGKSTTVVSITVKDDNKKAWVTLSLGLGEGYPASKRRVKIWFDSVADPSLRWPLPVAALPRYNRSHRLEKERQPFSPLLAAACVAAHCDDPVVFQAESDHRCGPV
jgi:hypothetical protein